MENITAVILAAGLGTRMKSEIPKVLHPVGSGTLLGGVIANLKKAGITDIVAVVGYKAEEVEEFFKNEKIRFVRQPELLGSGDALKCALEAIEGDEGSIVVTCGDAPIISDETYAALAEKYTEEKAACAVLTCIMPDPGHYGRIVRDENGEIEKIVEAKDADSTETDIKEINVGTYCFSKAHVKRFIRDIEINEKKKEFYLTDIVEILKNNDEKVTTASCDAVESIGVNNRKDLAEVNKIVNQKKLDELMAGGVTIMDPGTTNIDQDVEIGQDTVIFPNTVISGGVKIGAKCKIGPFARIRPGVTVADDVEIGNFVEINRTSIDEGTKVKHHTYLGDTVVGKNVNIGAGVITANYDGQNKHKTFIEDEVFVGVGVSLVAPVKIGKGAKIGAGSVVTRNKDIPAGETVVGVPARPFGKK